MIPEHHVAQGAMLANQTLMQMLQQIAPMFKQAEQVVQAKMPKPQLPPDVQASLQIAQAETQRKAEYDKATFGMKQQEMGISAKMEEAQAQFDRQLEMMKVQNDKQAADLSEQVKVMLNKQDNEQHQMTELLKNADDNATAMRMKMVELEKQVQETPAKAAEAAKVNQSQAAPIVIDVGSQMKQIQDALIQINDQKLGAAINPILLHLEAMMQHMTAPKRIIRHPETGKAMGVEVVSTLGS